VILVPRALLDRLSPAQIRAILQHELAHLRRGDVWLNCAQALLQIAYWWHPLLWLANARIRRLREEAVDDAVMLALRDDAETYAPTLLEVARLALHRPLASLGLVGILESQRSLRQRIERLIEFCPPGRTGFTFGSMLCVVALGAFALPMGEGPVKVAEIQTVPLSDSNTGTASSPGLSSPSEHIVQNPQEVKVGTTNQVAPAAENSELKAGGMPPTPPTNGLPNLVPSNSRRKAINERLYRIVLDDIGFENQPLSEVLPKLHEESQRLDPDSKGVQFFWHSESPPPEGAGPIDPATGLPIAGQDSPPDVGSIRIKISPALHGARLTDVLSAIVKGADKPIKWAVEDYGVVFSVSDGREPLPLYVRTFKVDRNALLAGLQRELGSKKKAIPSTVAEDLRSCFTNIGVNLDPPKAVFFNEGEATLIVRATLGDLGIIEKEVVTLSAPPPPQLKIKAKWVAMPEQDAKDFLKSQDLLGARTNLMSFTALLTAPKMADVLHSLNANPKADLVTDSSITILSGLHGQIQCVDLTTVVMGIDPKALNPPGVATNAFLTTTLPMGPTLDLNPPLGRDGQTIHLGIVATISEFLGYKKPTNSVTIYVSGKKSQTIPPLPQFYVSQVTNNVEIWDGQTLVLGGLQSEKISVLKDKVPVLGDVPLLGSLFRSESKHPATPGLRHPNNHRPHPKTGLIPSARNTLVPNNSWLGLR
jgi:hypothetical protein